MSTQLNGRSLPFLRIPDERCAVKKIEIGISRAQPQISRFVGQQTPDPGIDQPLFEMGERISIETPETITASEPEISLLIANDLRYLFGQSVFLGIGSEGFSIKLVSATPAAEPDIPILILPLRPSPTSRLGCWPLLV